ncbi:MAG: hypothetical protein HKN30_06780 [Sulfitobacter sp.]|nr:hypothetical protein [Sulfitobacter sp.]
MTREAFLSLTGPRLLHISAATNSECISARGLKSAADLALAAGEDPARLALRNRRIQLRGRGIDARLNHQRPLLLGRRKASEFLEGHSLASWAAQLDSRIFFWPVRQDDAFHGSFEIPTRIYRFDSGKLYDRLGPHLWLSPINSGSAARRPARRGDWLYVTAMADPKTFRENRRRRGLVKNPDRWAREVSCTAPLSPDLMAECAA